MVKQLKTGNVITVPAIDVGKAEVYILGRRPLIINRVSEKAQRELLFPHGPINAAERQMRLKHDPVAEFRASPYTLKDPSAETLLAMVTTAFKGAMMTAALDLPGTKKAQIGRLVWIEGEYAPVFGVPRLLMSVVRSADIARTPDIRTRLIVPEWATMLDIRFVQPLLDEQTIVRLLSAAGLTVGVGDYRPEKGKGSYGQFEIVGAHNRAAYDAVVECGRATQIAAMVDPVTYDQESQDLLDWWTVEVQQRSKRKSRGLDGEALLPGDVSWSEGNSSGDGWGGAGEAALHGAIDG